MSITSLHAYAKNGDHVSVTIDKVMSHAESKNAIWNPQGKMTLTGTNKASSNNDLHVVSKIQRNYFPDGEALRFTLSPGKSGDKSYTAESDAKYYVQLLNKNWAVMRACNGSGDLYD